MAKYLRDISLSVDRSLEEAKRWGYSSNFLEILYLDCLPKAQTNGIGKVIIEACKVVPVKKLNNMMDVLRLWKSFDFDAYWNADKEARKRIALDFLQAGLLEVAAVKGWGTDPFLDAYNKVLEKNFLNYRPWSKPVTSPNRKHMAQAWCNYDSDKAEVFIVILQRNEVLSKTLVTTVKPGDVWIREAVGKLEWISPEKVRLTSKDDKQSWEATLGQNELTSQP